MVELYSVTPSPGDSAPGAPRQIGAVIRTVMEGRGAVIAAGEDMIAPSRNISRSLRAMRKNVRVKL